MKVYTNIILEAVGPKSNLVISDQKDRILESAKHIHPYMNSYRTIAPDHNYIPPPPFKGINLESFELAPTLEEVNSIKGIGKDLSKLVLENSNIMGRFVS
jgi:predicted ribosome quality control (RQC) complex YloA/Tae2 family protein